MERISSLNRVLPAIIGLAAAGALLAMSATNAQAAFKLRLTTAGSPVVTVTDGSLLDEDTDVGLIEYGEDIGVFSTNIQLGASKPQGNSTVTRPEMHLANIQISSVPGGEITIELTDTGFSGSGVLNFMTEHGGSGSGTATMMVFINTDDVEFSQTGTKVSDFTDLGPYQSGWAAVDVSYSITLISTVNLPGGGFFSFDTAIKVPEPGLLALFGVGLLGLGFLARRRTLRPSAN